MMSDLFPWNMKYSHFMLEIWGNLLTNSVKGETL